MSISKPKRESIFNKLNGRCAYCGCKLHIKTFTVDHIIPRNSGGSNCYENLAPSCKSCNSSKSCGSIEWLRVRSQFIAKYERAISKDVIDFCIENNLIDHINLPDHKFYFEVV